MAVTAAGAARKLWLSWVVANALGELVGLGGVFGCGFLVVARFGEPTSTAATLGYLALALVLGAFEGAVVGAAQWRVLAGRIAALGGRAWILATVVGAVVAWMLGMLPSTLMSGASEAAAQPVEEPPAAVVLGFAALLGAVAGLVLAFAQWWVLRRRARRAGLWLPANALAWAAGMPWIFWLVGATVAERQDAPSVLLFVLGLGAAGALVGAIHGAFLLRIVAASRDDG